MASHSGPPPPPQLSPELGKIGGLLLRLLLPLTFQTDRSNEKATGVDMEVGLLEEAHFAPMTKL